MDRKVSSEIGMTWSGVPVIVPHTREYWELKNLLDMFSVEEQIDIFCMTDYLNELFFDENVDDALSETLRALTFVFDALTADIDFRQTLDNLGLRDSQARRKIGKLLVVADFMK